MNVYCATKFENKADFLALKMLLEQNGHTVAHDWTKENDANLTYPEKALFRQKCAVACRNGAWSAGAFVLIPTPEPMAGAFVELGLALAFHGHELRKIIVVDGFRHGLQKNVFYYLPNVIHVKDFAGVLQALKS